LHRCFPVMFVLHRQSSCLMPSWWGKYRALHAPLFVAVSYEHLIGRVYSPWTPLPFPDCGLWISVPQRRSGVFLSLFPPPEWSRELLRVEFCRSFPSPLFWKYGVTPFHKGAPFFLGVFVVVTTLPPAEHAPMRTETSSFLVRRISPP